MQLTAGLLFIALVLLGGIAVQRFLRQRRDCLLQSKIIASANCCVAVTDATAPRHPIVYVNPAFRLMTGYAESDLLGQTMAILAGSETDRTSLDKLTVALQDGRAGRICLRHYRKNGTPFWNEITFRLPAHRLHLRTNRFRMDMSVFSSSMMRDRLPGLEGRC